MNQIKNANNKKDIHWEREIPKKNTILIILDKTNF